MGRVSVPIPAFQRPQRDTLQHCVERVTVAVPTEIVSTATSPPPLQGHRSRVGVATELQEGQLTSRKGSTAEKDN